CQKYTISPFTF
nr:immunoglobulin light chain junction region [Macaca mulatta]MOW11385.1 immunoglobulin light chain junction region [Macaca mulatta]MOW11763.1 immunoglobulin light chain junction region [Macaca mulatta]MOW11784.1 immunoglobulin light chain junction region [Macaca mulatta]